MIDLKKLFGRKKPAAAAAQQQAAPLAESPPQAALAANSEATAGADTAAAAEENAERAVMDAKVTEAIGAERAHNLHQQRQEARKGSGFLRRNSRGAKQQRASSADKKGYTGYLRHSARSKTQDS